jgi:REDY-like protein HapK
MKTLIVLFNLKEGISATDYEDFAKELDIPTVKSLKSVSEFQVFKSLGIFGSDATPPYQYVEIIHFESIENLVSDMGKEPKMAEIPAKFQELADNPVFIVSESI